MSLYETGVRKVIDDYLVEKSKETRDYGKFWSASSAGYCQRKVIFERLGVPHVDKEDDARKQRLFTAGHIFHDFIQKLTRDTGVSIAQEVELIDEDLLIKGHFDDLVLIDGKLLLIDYKTVNSRSFLWAKKNGNAMNYTHRLQLGTYLLMIKKMQAEGVMPAWLHGLPTLTEARILKIEKENLMMMEQQLLWDTQLESDVLSYWNSLNTHWQAKTLPRCSCGDHDNGFMASEKYNPFWFNNSPCSLEWYKQWKENQPNGV